MRKIFHSMLCLLFVCCNLCVAAQSAALGNTDSAFVMARNLAFEGKRKEGRELALRVLQIHPSYLEVKTFIGRTYAWDGDYNEARAVFAEVMKTDQKLLDNYLAWSDAEHWADEPEKEMIVVDKGLTQFGDNPDLLYRKAKLLSLSGNMAAAKTFAQKALRKRPNYGAAYVLLQELRSQLLDNSVSAGYSYERFSKYYDPSYFSYIQASRTTALGSITARLNQATRFGKTAFQPEVDLYPRIRRGAYAYLNAGFSSGSLFPEQRYGAEIFASLPHSFEASAGGRYLNFGPQSHVVIYTGSIGCYAGNYWLSLRPYITPDSGRNSASLSFTVRRYFRNPENYFSLRIGAGISPELLNTQTMPGSYTKQFYGLHSQSVSMAYQHPLFKRWTVNGSIAAGRQEPLFAIGEYFSTINAAFSLKYRYK